MKKITLLILAITILTGCNQNLTQSNLNTNEIQIDDLILDPTQIDPEDLKTYFPLEYANTYSDAEPLGVTEATTRIWPNGKVYFRFASNISRSYKNAILNVCNSFSAFAKIQCIEDIQLKFHSVKVTLGNSGCNGYSSLGYKLRQTQVLHLNVQCSQDLLLNRLIPHELMHTLGINHEHQQPDRDQYLRINYNYLTSGKSHNFIRIRDSGLRTRFDSTSIMMYSSFTFAKVINGNYHFTLLKRSPTCDRVPESTLLKNVPTDCLLLQNSRISNYDKALIANLYR